MKKILSVMVVTALLLSACTEPFKKGDEGLEYKIISKGKGEQVKYGNFMELHIGQYYNTGKKDSLLSDSRTGIPAFEILDSVRTPMAYYKILSQLRQGDSVVIRVSADTIFKKNPESRPAFIKVGHFLITTVKLQNIYLTKEQADSARQAAIAIAEKVMAEKDALTIKADDKTLTDYFAKNNIKVSRAPQGTYVEIIQPGSGNNIDTSVVVKTNYTGKLMNATKAFDSNTDSTFGHMEPLLVNMTKDPSLGGPLIKGWNDGLLLLNKGAKAKFYVPSALGYGSRGMGQEIPPASILVFDIEVVDILNRLDAVKAVETERKKMEMMQMMQQQMMQQQQQQGQGQGQQQPPTP
ncbi:MAG: FKBP-type peptidyl-prolyl cis-trans isomerase [Ferruginibacter sp.]